MEARPTSPGGQEPPKYLRLPIESAKKLRWFDQHDLKMLIELHLREKHELYQANAALKDILARHGSAKAKQEAQAIGDAVDSLMERDVGINDVLVLSAQAEITQLYNQVADMSAQLRAATARSGPQPVSPQESALAITCAQEVPVSDLPASEREEATVGAPHPDEPACPSCRALQHQVHRLSTQLATVQDEAGETSALLNGRLQEARAEFAAAQQAQQDVLKVAQDGRLEAEERAVREEQRATQLLAQVDRLTASRDELRARVEREASRAARLESELNRLRAEGAIRAETDAQRAAAAARAQLAQLESQCAAQKQLNSSLQSQIATLEGRLAAAEAEAVRAAADARDLEAAAAERDELSMRLNAAEARLDDIRASSLMSGGMRELLQQSEARRAAAEDELMATAKLASALEARLAAATASAEEALVQMQQAELKVAAAHASVAEEVARRWADAGSDRSLWPSNALNEIESVETRLAALQAAHKDASNQVAQLREQLDAVERNVRAAESKAVSAEATAERVRQSSEQRERRLEAAALAAARQVDEFRAALSRLERERDALEEEKKVRNAASVMVSKARLRAGSGSISEADLPGVAMSPRGQPQLRAMDPVDMLYLKNVLLKFLRAYVDSRYQECEVLLPAVAAVLRASPAEFKALKDALARNTSTIAWISHQIGGAEQDSLTTN